jgi:hypothetical protein
MEEYLKRGKNRGNHLNPKTPESGRLIMGRISRGPTPTAGKVRPNSFPLKNSCSAPIAEPPPTQVATPAISTSGSASHDLRLLPS